MSHIFWWEGFIEVKQGLIKGPHSDLGSVEDSVESPWCKENLRDNEVETKIVTRIRMKVMSLTS